MRSFTGALTLSVLVAGSTLACSKGGSETTSAQSATLYVGTKTTYGQVTDGPAITPTQALAQVEELDGKPVRIEGTVLGVCQKRGCWIDVGAENGDKVRVKVKDGEVVFPPTVVGKRVVAEGTLVKIPADPATDGASCGGEDHTAHEEGHDCARPAGASARMDGVGATVFEPAKT